ncbi:hypothetical protein NMY22_g4711 [Coprinellus aureogranulatus]|nr:hypothetical protein NMY22_g4711 [Coprinellus aureogranulatus]
MASSSPSDARSTIFYERMFRSVSLYKSAILNPRNTEDVTHALWTVVFDEISRKHEIKLLPTPQFRIYVSPRDEQTREDLKSRVKTEEERRDGGAKSRADAPHDPSADFFLSGDFSMRTEADSKARGVITDFCVLMPLVSQEQIKKFVDRMQEVDKGAEANPFEIVSQAESAQESATLELAVPIIAELKRALSRHPADIIFYVENLHERLVEAQEQVKLQADCMFSSPKFECQQRILCVAAAGEYWSVMAYKRELARPFRIRDYELLKDETSEEVPEVGPQGFEVEQAILADEENLGKPNKPAPARNRYGQLSKDAVEEQKKQREKRLDARNARKAENDALLDDYFNYVNLTEGKSKDGQTYYTEKEMNTLYQKYRLLSAGHMKEEDTLGFRGVLYTKPRKAIAFDSLLKLHEEEDVPDVERGWTLPMRFGSPASKAYIEFLKSELEAATTGKGGYLIDGKQV